MSEILTAAHMRAIEQAAIDTGSVTGLELMERAGRGVVAAIFEEWPEMAKAPHSAVVLCGPGNNGGDGFVVARLLKDQHWDVEVFLYGDPEKLPPDARTNYERWCKRGAARPYIDEGEQAFELDADTCGPETVLIDAVFGASLSRPVVDLNAAGWVTQVAPLRPGVRGWWPAPRIVAVDVPSGLCCDSGRVLHDPKLDVPHKEGMRAHLTVTFHASKLGHVLADGPEICGKVVVKDIGLKEPGGTAGQPPAAPPGWGFSPTRGRGRPFVHLAGPAQGAFLLKDPNSHKYGHGHALILSGPMGRSGAARLAARGALRVGAGLVTVGAPGSAMMECATQLTAIMLRKCNGAEGLAALLEDPRLNALCLGPGLGVGEETRALVGAALSAQRATVLDADALSAFADAPEALFEALHPQTVLTPHGGEFKLLFPDIAGKLAAPATKGPAYSKVDATRAAAVRAGCTVLFKGPDTVIASPDGRCAINAAVYDRAAPWLATAGSGDVLAGIITGLLARGLTPQEAYEAGAWLHVEAARAFGPGLIAEDLPEMLPRVFQELGF